MRRPVRSTARVAALVLGVALFGGAGADAAAAKKLTIEVLSGRGDLVSGGDALIAIHGVRSKAGLQIRAGGKDQKRRFTVVDGTLEGVVKGLPLGRSKIVAKTKQRGAKLFVTNHPQGGPVFSGPQLQPWGCQETAVDAQCNQPPAYTYLYKSTNPLAPGWQDYDPGSPPSDVAMTTTDEGVEVPFIVRVETGYIDRDQYQVATLFQPGERWKATKPQQQFNGKLLVTHGFGCGVDYKTATAPAVTGRTAEVALGRGYATMSNALDNSSHNCNVALQAESVLMTKEHVIDTYGPLRYTIGTGCSGGSLAVQWISNAYPGVYQGILPSCSFPDAWSTATQFLDYHLLIEYFTDPAKWGLGVLWTPDQMAAVEGHVTILNAQVSEAAQFHVVVPTDPCRGTTDADRYSTSNLGGVRCSVADAAINLFGPRQKSAWTPEEKALGRGFAGLPVDNVGVQYGLSALRNGLITPAQFVDMNAKLGGLEPANITPVPNRISADRPALANAYRTGMINETNNLDKTAIIDCRGPDPGLFHDAYRAFAVRARLDREHGGHPNQLIWEGPAPIIADTECELNSFKAMDEWMAAVERDTSKAPLARKVAINKPGGLTDRCYLGGAEIRHDLCGPAVVPIYGTPRTVAGDALTTDTNKCQLMPLDRNSNYGPFPFTNAQWAQLQAVFPDGVCDFSKPGVDQQGTIPWQTYQDANGNVIYGGEPLGPTPKSKRLKLKRRR